MKIYLLSAILAGILSIVLGLIALPLLRKLKFGQPILKYVEKHKQKNGTPTMGGLFFVSATAISFLVLTNGQNRLSIIALAVTLGFMLVGFIDDVLKIKLSKNEGLTPLQKILFQLAISLTASYFAYDSGLNFLYLPFSNGEINVGVFGIALNVLVFISTVNSVNLTDGLDGLCSSVSVVVLISLALLILLQVDGKNGLYVISSEYKNLSLLCVSMAGALLGYLVFNVNKASVFMGDTGSLAIGGTIASVSVLSGNTLYIPLMGICFVLSSLSVIIQVLYYKKTKKRVFLMAPIHHHFQEKGFTEAKISYVYSFVTALICATLLIFVGR